MKKNSKNIFQEIDAFFEKHPTSNQKAWGVINQFYHLILTYMEENNITQSDLARKLGKSRSAISQLFSKTPNISVKKMVEIANAVGIDIEIFSPQVAAHKSFSMSQYDSEDFFIRYFKKEWMDIQFESQFYNIDFDIKKVKDGISIPANLINDYSHAYIN